MSHQTECKCCNDNNLIFTWIIPKESKTRFEPIWSPRHWVGAYSYINLLRNSSFQNSFPLTCSIKLFSKLIKQFKILSTFQSSPYYNDTCSNENHYSECQYTCTTKLYVVMNYVVLSSHVLFLLFIKWNKQKRIGWSGTE